MNRFLILLIVATLTATVIESVPEMANAYVLPLSAIEWTATLVFSLEYAARLWSSAEHPLLKHHRAFFGRLRFALSFEGETGPYAQFNSIITAGLKTGVEEVNADGGINGRQVVLITRNDGGDPGTALSAAKYTVFGTSHLRPGSPCAM